MCAVVAAALIGVVRAQGTTTTLAAFTSYSPTAAWSPVPTCSQGSTPASNPGGGVYTDEFGNYWAVTCGAAFQNTVYYDNKAIAVNNQGIGPCFYGCALRPECVGFTFAGSVGSSAYPWTGSNAGRCYHYLNGTQGALAPQAQIGTLNVYGSAYLLQAAPGLLCPFYDNQVFNDNWGESYNVKCGYEPVTLNAGNGGQVLTQSAVPNVQSCLSACDAFTTTATITRPNSQVVTSTQSCVLIGYSYQPSAEPSSYRNDHSSGICAIMTGSAVPTNTGSIGPYMYAERRISTAGVGTTTTTTTTPTTTTTVSALQENQRYFANNFV